MLFDSSSDLLLSGGEDDKIIVRDLAAAQAQSSITWTLPLTSTNKTVYGLALSKDGRRLASATSETITLWNVDKKQITFDQVIPRDKDDTDTIFALAMHSDDKGDDTLAWGTADGKLWVYNIR